MNIKILPHIHDFRKSFFRIYFFLLFLSPFSLRFCFCAYLFESVLFYAGRGRFFSGVLLFGGIVFWEVLFILGGVTVFPPHYRPIAIMVRLFATCLRDRSNHTKDFFKRYLMPPCLTQHYKVGIKVKWSNPEKGVAPSPIFWGSVNLRMLLLSWEFFTSALSDSLKFEWQKKFPRTLLSILNDFSNAGVWMVSFHPLISNSSSLFFKVFRNCLKGPKYEGHSINKGNFLNLKNSFFQNVFRTLFFRIIFKTFSFFQIFSIDVNSILFKISLLQKYFILGKIVLRLFKMAENQSTPGLNTTSYNQLL